MTTNPLDTPVSLEQATAFRAPTVGASRRSLLRAAGLAALVGGSGVLAACSSPHSATPAAPAASSAASGGGVAAAAVPVGGGVILTDADYVVTQPAKGSYKAFSSICTHQGCKVAEVVDKQIVCRCHQSHFSITDGSVVSGPAPKPLPESTATVSGAKIVIS